MLDRWASSQCVDAWSVWVLAMNRRMHDGWVVVGRRMAPGTVRLVSAGWWTAVAGSWIVHRWCVVDDAGCVADAE